jgi:hypothetical protein
MKRSRASKTSLRKRAAKPTSKDPRGGLTAAGRKEFFRKEGAHLKPGVKKPERQMTVEEMRRKGSWAARFYGRSGSLPPLRDKHGKPSRFALTAAAWGEPVPKTTAAARKIAEKGRRLLARVKNEKRATR